ncbi:MAG: ATP-dependent RNA helicase HrpA [Pseudomonadota bacterium]
MAQLAGCTSAPCRRLRGEGEALHGKLNAPDAEARLARWCERVERWQARRMQRMQYLPRPDFPEELPVSARREEIAAAIAAHQVVIVCGETGSGKTTQLPKICLALGRGIDGQIGHTQPRRIAARSVASRIAHELKCELGGAVGYKVRFADHVDETRTYVKLMTDGILLAETQQDPVLSAYDTLIIDEAHERSLNIDFLLGYLKQLLPRRPDLKIIVTSATIDAERFSKHFDGAPVFEVSGRLYPVEVRYRAFEPEDREYDLNDAICDAVHEVAQLGMGDVLVFLPGEREIREAAEALRKRHPPHTEILPLYARLSAAEQGRVFRPSNARRIVLATNVAETSLTVPGIRYVVDTGLARVKRYSYRNKVEQLQVEKISRAAANQRAGRCGRVAAGVCVRLYDETDFAGRPAYTDPEILRSSLASVILRMQALKLGTVEGFPFLEAPPPKAVSDGYQLLAELGAVDEQNRLTKLGAELARLPLDPKIARMILAARDEDCLSEVLVIAAALSVQDPRERPHERAGSADNAHQKFADEKSEFLSYLKLWKFFDEVLAHKKSTRKLAELCRENFLSFTRMREWRDTHGQLHALVAELGWRRNETPASYEQVHRALLAGLLGNVGCKSDEAEHYLGARGIKFHIFPGSALAKKAGRWIMAAEITETTRLYARCVARIEPQWLESVGAHLLKKSRHDPHWEKKAAQVVALERATLYGLVVYSGRRVHFGPMDPGRAREVFIRQGLVGGEYETRAPFFEHNRKLIRDIQALEHKSRRPDVLVDEELIYAFYDSVIPADIHNGAAFESWRKEVERGNARLLYLKREDLMRHEAAGITTEQFPNKLDLGGAVFALSYHFEPGSARDGVTLTAPLALLNQVSAARCEWLVPGLLKEKVAQLLKSLPQKLRRHVVPVPEFAEKFAALVTPGETPLLQALAAHIRAQCGVTVPLDAFRLETLQTHLFMNFKVVDEHGRQLGMSRNLAQLRGEFGQSAQQQFAQSVATEGAGAPSTDWDFGDLPDTQPVSRGGQQLLGYPAVCTAGDAGDGVVVKVLDGAEAARAQHRLGLRRLFLLQLKEQVKYLEKSLPSALAMQYLPFGSGDELKRDIAAAAVERACLMEPLPRTRAQFVARKDEARVRLILIGQELVRLLGSILAEYVALQKKLATAKNFAAQSQDIRAQCERLLPKGFLATVPYERLQHYPRYLKAAVARLDKLRADAARDARQAAELAPLERDYTRRLAQCRKQGVEDARLEEFRWLLEELRVSLFAQELKTPLPVSAKRLHKVLQSMQ